jgi:Rieske Fe-S protein
MLGAAAAGLPLLAACSPPSDAGGTGGTTGTTLTVPTSEVSLHGGAIQDQVVVTQPTEGTYKAFSAICPHQGCTVASVTDDVITCPCHGSTFNAADGARISGPATRGLTSLGATVDGAEVVVTL